MLTLLLALLIANWTLTILTSLLIGWIIIKAYKISGYEGVSAILDEPFMKRMSLAISMMTIVGLILVQLSYVIVLNS